jgi:hypothetical protein
MPWTAPMTFSTNAILQAAQLNTHLRDNLIELKDPPTTVISSTTAYSTTSTSFVDINAALEATIVTNGGRLQIVYGIVHSVNGFARLLLNGSPLAIIAPVSNSTSSGGVTWTGVLSAGTHVIKPQWFIASGTLTMTSYNIVVREVS